MSEEESSNVNDTIKAVTGLVKEVPIYQDAIQPIAKEVGKTLQTIGKAVNSALLPVRGLVWGIEKFEDFIKIEVEKNLLIHQLMKFALQTYLLQVQLLNR